MHQSEARRHVWPSCVLPCSNSLQTQLDSSWLSSMRVRRERTCDAKSARVLVRVCVYDSSPVPARLGINLSFLVLVCFYLSLILSLPLFHLQHSGRRSFPPTFSTLSLSLSPNFSLRAAGTIRFPPPAGQSERVRMGDVTAAPSWGGE